MATKNVLSFGSNIGFDTERSSIHFYYYYYHHHLFSLEEFKLTIYRNSKESVTRKKRSENGLIQQLSVIWRITFENNIKQESCSTECRKRFLCFPISVINGSIHF